ncbi:hypothetical protein FCO27_16355 [Bacillus pumilus]|uniref:hypothetical protein n=1 Tax=Bacillus pumilus TaxID=1408 RepID=UPI0010BED1F4|nr:hypothetical protein [Bacillus pumilus]TKI22314.1 hypothetical protein FCO27_16355 [Bacillus pumilus]
MEQAALKKMRTKQIGVSNLIFGLMIIAFFMVIQIFNIQLTHFFLCLGILMLLQGIIGFIKKGKTKFFIPIFEQVAIYEKEKLGKEWKKEKFSENVWKVVLSGIMFFQSFSFQNVTNPFSDIEPVLTILLFLIVLASINISMLFRFRKIDRSTEGELTGYTKESNMMGIALGLLMAIIISIFIVIFLLP